MSSKIGISEGSGVRGSLQQRQGLASLSMWNIYSYVYDLMPRYFRAYQKLLADVVSAVETNTPKGGKILDSGCGTGNFSIGLGLKGYNVEGIDISHAMLERARLKKKKAGLENVEFKEWDIEKGLALYPDANFDCVVSVHALYTLREPEATIREYLRVLKPSGHLITAEPSSPIRIIPIAKEIYHEGGLRDVAKLLFTQSGVGICNLLIGKRLRNGSYHYWDEARLRSVLQQGCFRMDDVVPAYSAGSDLLATAVKPRHCFEMNGYRFLSAETREDLEKVWRLRYQVYCIELGDVPENQSGLERDKYDDYAISFLAVDENDGAVGTIRLVHNNPKGFPMDSDFPLTDYMKTHGVSRALEIGRFAIKKSVSRDAHISAALGLFKCLYDYCYETRTYDVFAVTNPKTMEKYGMPGVNVIGEPFRYSKPLTGGLWVPVHANIRAAREGYENYLARGQGSAKVA
jgi:ubiquinone/menaquinone biosynthesis C-methylase UbiE/N-acyl-L-homoserine lactone synthetase